MKKIIHVDMDAFFVSVEIRDDPRLEGKPVAVGGSRRKRGVLSTCNYVARQFGLHSAMSTAQAMKLCPELIVLPGRMSVYREISQQIRDIFTRFTTVIEPLGLDEAYLDVSHSSLCYGSATLMAQEICYQIYQELNLTASAGVAPIKFLAKVASDMNKPNGIYVIAPENVSAFIDAMPLNKIPGVGKVTYQKLLAAGLVVGKDIKKLEPASLIGQYGSLGELLWQRCQGIDEREVITHRERKSLGVERTFEQDVSDIKILTSLMLEYLLPKLKLRMKPYLKKRQMVKLGVKLKFSDFQVTTKECASQRLDEVLLHELLYQAVERGLGKAVRLLGLYIQFSPQGLRGQQSQQISFDW